MKKWQKEEHLPGVTWIKGPFVLSLRMQWIGRQHFCCYGYLKLASFQALRILQPLPPILRSYRSVLLHTSGFPMCPGDWTQIVRFRGRCLYLLNHFFSYPRHVKPWVLADGPLDRNIRLHHKACMTQELTLDNSSIIRETGDYLCFSERGDSVSPRQVQIVRDCPEYRLFSINVAHDTYQVTGVLGAWDWIQKAHHGFLDFRPIWV